MNVEEPERPAPEQRGITQWARNLIQKHRTFAKFALVGASGVLVNEVVYYLLTRYAGLPYIPSQAVGIEIAIINNFSWNDAFTFKGTPSESKSKLGRFAKYNLLSLITFSLNLIVFTILLSFRVWDIYASMIAIVAAFALNYLGSSRWAWRRAENSKKKQSG